MNLLNYIFSMNITDDLDGNTANGTSRSWMLPIHN